MVPAFYRVNHMLNVRVRYGMDIYCLILYVLDIFVVRLDMLCLRILGKLLNFNLCLFLWLVLIILVHFYNRCRSLSILLWIESAFVSF